MSGAGAVGTFYLELGLQSRPEPCPDDLRIRNRRQNHPKLLQSVHADLEPTELKPERAVKKITRGRSGNRSRNACLEPYPSDIIPAPHLLLLIFGASFDTDLYLTAVT